MEVIQGNISQFIESFPSGGQGRQCTGVAASACCLLLRDGPESFTPFTIDECVRVGVDLFHQSLERLPKESQMLYMEPDELQRTAPFYPQPIHFDVDLINTVSCNLLGESDIWLSLHGGLQRIFQLHEAALMITSDYTVGVYKKSGENEVWLFDSHARGENGLHDPQGTAVLIRFRNINQLKDHILSLYGVGDKDLSLTGILLTDHAHEVADSLDASIECDSLCSRSVEFTVLSSPRAAPRRACHSGHVGKCCSNCSCNSCCSCNISCTSSERTFEQHLVLGIRHLAFSGRTYSSVLSGASIPDEHSYAMQPSPATAASTPASSPGRGSSPPMSPWHAAWPPLPPPHGSLTPTFVLDEDSTPAQSPWSSIVVALSDTTSTNSSITIVSASDLQGSSGRVTIDGDDETFDLLSLLGDANFPSDFDADNADETLFDLSFLEEANLTCSDIDQDQKLATPKGDSLSMDSSLDMVTSHMDGDPTSGNKYENSKPSRQLSKKEKASLRKKQMKRYTQQHRQDESYRSDERAKDAERKRNTRNSRRCSKDSKKQMKKQMKRKERNNQSMQEKRRNDDYRRAEAHQNLERIQELRRHKEFRNAEALRNRERLATYREDPNFHTNEREQSECAAIYENKLANYFKLIKLGPTLKCCCCGQLWFPRSVKYLSEEQFASKGAFSEWKNVCTCRDDSESPDYILCSTCNKYLFKQKKIPPLALCNGLGFEDIPIVLSVLTPMEERLVSPRLVFMSILRLGCDRQYGLRGSCVNVPNDINTMVTVLPRMPDDTHTVQLKIVRRMRDQHAYAFDRVRPAVVFRAAQYLMDTPLYRKHNIVLSEEWLEQFIEVYNSQSVQEEAMLEDEGGNIPQQEGTNANSAAAPASEEDSYWNELNEEEIVLAEQETLLDDITIPEQDTGIRIAPGENRIPTSILFDEDIEELAFPTISGGNIRNVRGKVSMADLAKVEGRLYDRRCAKNIPKMFLTFCRIRRKRLADKIQIAMRKKKTGGRKITARDVVNANTVNELVQHNEGYRILAVYRSSPAFWEAKKKTLFAMVRQFGVPTLFLTFSCAETRWLELIVVLKKTVDNEIITEENANDMSWQEKVRLVQSDPYTVARYNDHKMREAWKLMSVPGGPLEHYPVKHSYRRVEFQHRGTAHWHSIVWLDGAPLYDPNDPESVERVLRFIDELITCFLDHDLGDSINVQFHKHSRTCHREVRGVRVCRFGVPFPPMPRTMILTPLGDSVPKEELKRLRAEYRSTMSRIEALHKEGRDLTFDELLEVLGYNSEEDYLLVVRSQLKRAKVYLRRNLSEIRLNNYNKKLLIALLSNGDMQYVLDALDTIVYVVDYINKAQRGLSLLIRETAQEVREGNQTVVEQLRAISNVFINKSEVSAQEVAYHNLGMPMSMCSDAEIFINTSPEAYRVRLVMDPLRLQAVFDENPDSEEIYFTGIIHRYTQRPDSMEDMCLAEFAGWYVFSKTAKKGDAVPRMQGDSEEMDVLEEVQLDEDAHEIVENSPFYQLRDKSRYVRRRTKTKILRYRNYSATKDPENYMREQLMLFSHWRAEAEFWSDVRGMFLFKLEEIKKHRAEYVKLDMDLDEILEEVLRDNPEEDEVNPQGQNDEAVPARDMAVFELDEGDGADIGPDIAPDVLYTRPPESERFILPRHKPQEEYLSLIARLNDRQRRYHDNLMYILKTQPGEQVLHFVSGGAGVGKSTLIDAVTQSAIRVFIQQGASPDDLTVARMAPTGRAAYNIRAVTLQSGLNLYGANLSAAVDPSTLNTMRTAMGNVRIVIIDEISMVGGNIFEAVEKRLQLIFGNKRVLANLIVLVFGDMYQLKPVFDHWIFESKKNDDLSLLAGPYTWRQFKNYQLTEVMRQREDHQFAEALNRLAVGGTTAEDDELFASRELGKLRQQGIEAPDDAVRMYEANLDVNEHNIRYLNGLNTECCYAEAMDYCEGEGTAPAKSKQLDKIRRLPLTDTQNLPLEFTGKVSARYMMTVNQRTEDGLTNGATGTLRKIVWGKNASNERVPLRLYIEFDEEVGQKTRSDNAQVMRRDGADEQWTPVERVSRPIIPTKGSTFRIIRKQFPFVPAKAITVYKSQGSTNKIGGVIHTMSTGKKTTQDGSSQTFYRSMRRRSLYVGSSRVTSLSKLFFGGKYVRPRPIALDDPTAVEMKRLSEPENQVKFELQFPELITTEDNVICLFQNMRSLHKHHKHIVNHSSWAKNEDIPSLTIPGYQVMHSRNCVLERRHAYGTILYVRESLSTWIEMVFTEDAIKVFRGKSLHFFIDIIGYILQRNGQRFGVVFLHRSPKSNLSLFETHLQKCLDKLKNHGATSITAMGDFNIIYLEESQEAMRLTNFMTENNLTLCMEKTIASTDHGTLLDLCFSDNRNMQAVIMESMMTDHKGLWVVLDQYSSEECAQQAQEVPSVDQIDTEIQPVLHLDLGNPSTNPLQENNDSLIHEEDPQKQGPKRQAQLVEPQQPLSKKRKRQRPKRFDND